MLFAGKRHSRRRNRSYVDVCNRKDCPRMRGRMDQVTDMLCIAIHMRRSCIVCVVPFALCCLIALTPSAQLFWLPAIVWFCPPEYAIARKLGRREFFGWRRRDCDILKLRMVNISPSFNVEVSRRGGSGVGWSGGPCGRLWSGADRAGNDGRPQGPQPRIHATPAPTRYPDHVA